MAGFARVTAEEAARAAAHKGCSTCSASAGTPCGPGGQVHRARALRARNDGLDVPSLPRRPRKKRINYREYIASSPRWQEKRAAYYIEYGSECRVPGCQRRAYEVHHHTYARLGDERVTDLVGLCDYHHKKVHSLYDSKKDWLRELPNPQHKRLLTLATEIVLEGEKLIP